MRAGDFSERDVGATALVAVAVGAYALREAGLSVPGFGSARVMAVGVLVLGAMACGAGRAQELYQATDANGRALATALSVLGALTFAFGIAAIVTGSALPLTVLMTGTLLLWAAATGRHLTARSPRDHHVKTT